MLEQILAWDEALFLGINHSHLPGFDTLMPFYRNKLFWAPLYFFLVTFILWNFPKNGLWILLFSVLTVGVADTVSSTFIKKSVQRMRPCNDPELRNEVVLRIRCGGGYSFTSSHATNHASVAVFFFLLFQDLRRVWRFLLLGWAFSIGLAQIYVGVHYPLDVLGGFILGSTIGFILAYFYHKVLSLD